MSLIIDLRDKKKLMPKMICKKYCYWSMATLCEEIGGWCPTCKCSSCKKESKRRRGCRQSKKQATAFLQACCRRKVVLNHGPPDECSICFTDLATHRTGCGHFFCPSCIGEWQKNAAGTCPLCRACLDRL